MDRDIREASGSGSKPSFPQFNMFPSTIPSFIKETNPDWNYGQDLKKVTKNVVFSKCPEKLENGKNQLIEVTETVTTVTDLESIKDATMEKLNSVVGTAIGMQKQSDPPMKQTLEEFKQIQYESPVAPKGLIELRDDFIFTWYTKGRIGGKGKFKAPQTVRQYATTLFCKADNLYKTLELSGLKLEDTMFPTSRRFTLAMETWGKVSHPSTTGKFFFFFLNLK